MQLSPTDHDCAAPRGALAPVSCVSEKFYEKCSCPDESRCPIRSVMKEIREAIVQIAERTTIADCANGRTN